MHLRDVIGPLERPLIFLDTETTGRDPRNDRIVELGLIQFKPDGTEREWRSYVNPGVPIPREATYGDGARYPGHGITDEMVAGAPTFDQLAPNLLAGFKNCDYGGCNVRSFDLPLLAAEFERAKHTWEWSSARIVDIYRIWQLGEERSLTAAVERFLGKDHLGAHGALADVRASIDVATEMLGRAFPGVPRQLDALHQACWPKDPSAIDAAGKIVWRDGAAVINFGKKWRGIRLDKMAKRDLLWVADKATEISTEVRNICRAAADGVYPVKGAA